jgi:hypothetical protein
MPTKTAATEPAALPTPATPRERRAAFWRMTADERRAAYRRGELSLAECLRWAARAPTEPPLLNGEFEFIAALTPEVAELER